MAIVISKSIIKIEKSPKNKTSIQKKLIFPTLTTDCILIIIKETKQIPKEKSAQYLMIALKVHETICSDEIKES